MRLEFTSVEANIVSDGDFCFWTVGLDSRDFFPAPGEYIVTEGYFSGAGDPEVPIADEVFAELDAISIENTPVKGEDKAANDCDVADKRVLLGIVEVHEGIIAFEEPARRTDSVVLLTGLF